MESQANSLELPPSILRILSLSLPKQLLSIIKSLQDKYPDDSPLDFSSFIFASDDKLASTFKTIKIQTAWRMKRLSRNFKIRQKKLRHRKFIIEELIFSEENYGRSLDLIVTHIVKPCENCEILTKNEIHSLFSYLPNIALFSKELSDSLRKRLEKFDAKTTKFLDIFLDLYDFFKIYSPYCNNFTSAQTLISELRSDPLHKFSQLLKKLEFSQPLQNLSLSDHLIKPVQRLPKYELLFKDLMKNTEKSHPDYENIALALEKYKGLNHENNMKMEKYLKQLRLFELQKLFGSKELNLFDKHRKFLQEEALFLIKDDMPRPIVLYILSDMLLVTEASESVGVYRMVHQLKLNEASFVCDLQNTRYFKWIFSVYGPTGGLIFLMDSKPQKTEIMKTLETVISGLKRPLTKEFSMDLCRNNEKKLIRLSTIGTLRRGIRGFKPYTLYVIEVKMTKFGFRLYIRFSELIELEEIVKNRISTIKIPHFPKTLSNFFLSQSLKTIETRKLMIENFLQTILQNAEIANSAREILGLLSLSKDFFEKEIEKEEMMVS